MNGASAVNTSAQSAPGKRMNTTNWQENEAAFRNGNPDCEGAEATDEEAEAQEEEMRDLVANDPELAMVYGAYYGV
jgi:hypothetical protein